MHVQLVTRQLAMLSAPRCSILRALGNVEEIRIAMSTGSCGARWLPTNVLPTELRRREPQ